MTENDVIRMARLAGYDLEKDETCREVSTAEIFGAFARLVAAHEREECAKVCEGRATPGTGSVAILNGAADAIRARKPA